jgi:hypothetical protein
MDGYVAYHQGLDGQTLGRLLDRLFAGGSYYIVRKVEDVGIDSFAGAQALLVWPEGQVFSSKIEIRWRRLPGPGELHWVLALTEAEKLIRGDGEEFGLLAEGFEEVKSPWGVEEYAGHGLGIYLWGERKEGQPDWVETRIPRRLRYPLDKAGRARIGHYRYYRRDSGATQYIRLAEVTHE